MEEHLKALQAALIETRDHVMKLERVLYNSNIIWDGPAPYRCPLPPSANSGPSSADTEEVPSPRPPVSPAGAAISRCPCCHTPGGRHDPWCQYPRDYGPTGAAAAKESTDNAAAPEGAANDRECNCDQALHLERRIGDAVRAIRRSSTIPAGLLHELLGILEGEA